MDLNINNVKMPVIQEKGCGFAAPRHTGARFKKLKSVV
jgi:hypothetical protein